MIYNLYIIGIYILIYSIIHVHSESISIPHTDSDSESSSIPLSDTVTGIDTDTNTVTDTEYGIQFHEYAMKLINDNINGQEQDSYQDALPYFRAAVRMKPQESLYLNDLGVTEMRMVCVV